MSSPDLAGLVEELPETKAKAVGLPSEHFDLIVKAVQDQLRETGGLNIRHTITVPKLEEALLQTVKAIPRKEKINMRSRSFIKKGVATSAVTGQVILALPGQAQAPDTNVEFGNGIPYLIQRTFVVVGNGKISSLTGASSSVGSKSFKTV